MVERVRTILVIVAVVTAVVVIGALWLLGKANARLADCENSYEALLRGEEMRGVLYERWCREHVGLPMRPTDE